MQPLAAAALTEPTREGARFVLDDGWECRLLMLEDDMARVLFVPAGGLREPRTWMIARNGTDVPWEGRDRLDPGGFRLPRFKLDDDRDQVVLRTAALHVRVRL